jgi:halogenation protein CepH
MSPSGEEHFDVVVVGGGPGGSTLASLVAKRGNRVLLLEKERFPRYQIGESLLPATVHGVCGLLGVAEQIQEAGFLRKHGGTFRWGTNPEPWSFVFSFSPRMAGPNAHAYQVERQKFDEILLNHSRKVGVDVREECTVADVIEQDGRVTGLSYVDAAGCRRSVTARFVVDASGNKSRLYGGVGGKRVYSEFFRNIAIFGYFAGGVRLPEPRTGNIFCEAFSDGWFWYIPLADNLTSVGAVVSRESADRVQGDPEQAWLNLIQKSPRIRAMLDGVPRASTPPYDQVRVRKDYSYLNSRFWKPGMVLVGDAACFIDPVFSSGVHLATYSALLAARSINTVLAGMVDEERAFAEFEARYRREYGLFYEFLVSFYETNRDEQSYYWQAKKVARTDNTEIEAFVELVGGVASGESALVDPESARTRLKQNAASLEDSVAEVSRGGGDIATPFYQSEVVGDLMDESLRVQQQAAFGVDVDDETPLFEGGLITAEDGLGWVVPHLS